jgi:hypothetical protein
MVGPSPDKPAGPPEPRPKGGLKAGINLLIRFHIVTKNARLYETNNTLFREQVQALYDSLDVILKEGQEASFEVRHSAFFFNGTRMKFVMSTYAIFRYVLDEFRVRDIGALTFKPGLTSGELGLFIAAFGRKEKSA